MNPIPGHEPTVKDVDAMLSGATPHFAMQLKARLWDLVRDLPADHDTRRYAAAQAELLDRMTRGTTRAPMSDRGRAPDTDPGWREIPSHPSGDPR